MISNSASKQLLPGGAGCGKRTANTHSLPTGHAKANLFWGKKHGDFSDLPAARNDFSDCPRRNYLFSVFRRNTYDGFGKDKITYYIYIRKDITSKKKNMFSVISLTRIKLVIFREMNKWSCQECWAIKRLKSGCSQKLYYCKNQGLLARKSATKKNDTARKKQWVLSPRPMSHAQLPKATMSTKEHHLLKIRCVHPFLGQMRLKWDMMGI